MKEFLKQYIENHKDEMLKDLADFVAIPSISSDIEKVTEALEFALKLGADMGFRVENYLDGQVGVIEIGEGEETLGILSHVDVVPAEDLDEWETDPFEAVIKDGKVYGRGTIDDKGMIIASLYAMKAVLESGAPLMKKVQLILGMLFPLIVNIHHPFQIPPQMCDSFSILSHELSRMLLLLINHALRNRTIQNADHNGVVSSCTLLQ